MEKKGQLFTAFLEDLEQSLEDFDQAILSIEKDPEVSVEQIFRIFHSIKASTRILSFNQFSEFTHLAESLLSQVRSGAFPLDESLGEFFFELYDLFKMFKEKVALGYDESDFLKNQEWQTALTRLLERLKQKISLKETKGQDSEETKRKGIYQIQLDFDPDIFLSGADPLVYVTDLFDKTRVLSCTPKTRSIPRLEELNPLKYYISWKLRVETALSEKQIREIFAFLDEEKNTLLITPEKPEIRLPGYNLAPPSEEKEAKPLEEKELRSAEFVRVPVPKLDELLNLFGELVIGFSQAEAATGENRSPESQAAMENLSRIMNHLQNKIMNIRMVSVAPLFQQFHRFVLESARSLKKKARLEVSGEETELDKNMMNQIGEPLKHLVRNCLDHGLESEEERIQAGKPPEGKIVLSAQCRDDGIFISVSDDGRGLDPEKIIQKALSSKLMTEEEARSLKPEQIYDFLFLPGFSTRETVSDFSGRGVGLDVVKSRVEAVRGSIEVQTQKGLGTAFILRLPLTLSILNTVLFRAGQEKFAVPIFNIRELVKFKQIEMESFGNRIPMLKLRNEYYPVFRLNQFFSEVRYENTDFLKGFFLLLEIENKKFFLFTDEILGEQQTVIKKMPLLEKYRNGLLGTSILGNGDILFILDVYTLTNRMIREMDLEEIKENGLEKENHSNGD